MKTKKMIYRISILIFMIDQIIKLWIIHNMHLYQVIPIITNFFSLCYVKNTGAAFSILENNTILLIIISTIFLFFLNHYIYKETKFSTLLILSLGLLQGGILGNLSDRMFYHEVIDYLSFVIFRYDFPIFNFADAAIDIGVFLFIVDFILEKRKEEKNGTL